MITLRRTGVSEIRGEYDSERKCYMFHVEVRGHKVVFVLTKEELETLKKEED